jgi:DNA-binding CsgD family transcriptional regulator
LGCGGASFASGLAMTAQLRNSGIPLVDQIPWGAHLCLFYETNDDLLDTAAGYFGAGLEAHEYCVWAISDPVSEQEAMVALREAIPDFDRHLAAGAIELLPGREWYLNGDEFDMQRITGGWSEKQRQAMARGFEGMRVSGNAFWLETNHWREFAEYERELDRSLSGQPMLVLCTYPLNASGATDILDVVRTHNFTLARRQGEWQFMETPELRQANERIQHLNDALAVISGAFPGHEKLTERERAVLAQVVTGASSKEAARKLGISPRTVDFHRANIIEKLGAKNTADLIRRVLSR